MGFYLTAIGRRQLVASLRIAEHVADREVIAAFFHSEATEVSPNPFPLTSVGAQSHIWAGQSFEFRSSQTASLGLACLLKALGLLPGNEPLAQEIFRSGPYRAYVYHPGDGCQIVGAVLHGRAGVSLPVIECLPRPRTRRRSNPASRQQLDLFALAQQA